MANASLDVNGIASLIAVDSSDGTTIRKILANPTTHGVKISNGTSGNDLGPTNAPHDNNTRHCMLAVSSSDGKTPVVVYCNSSGYLLVQST